MARIRKHPPHRLHPGDHEPLFFEEIPERIAGETVIVVGFVMKVPQERSRCEYFPSGTKAAKGFPNRRGGIRQMFQHVVHQNGVDRVRQHGQFQGGPDEIRAEQGIDLDREVGNAGQIFPVRSKPSPDIQSPAHQHGCGDGLECAATEPLGWIELLQIEEEFFTSAGRRGIFRHHECLFALVIMFLLPISLSSCLFLISL